MARSRRRSPSDGPTQAHPPAGAAEPGAATPDPIEPARDEVAAEPQQEPTVMTASDPPGTTAPAGEPVRPAAPPEVRVVRRGGWGPGFLGGLIGGLLVAGGAAWYLTTQPFVPPVLTTRLEALESARGRLDSVATETASLRERSETTASNIGNLQQRVASLEQAGAAAPERLNALEQAVRELRDRVDGARATTDTIAGDVRGRLEELRAQVDRLATQQQQLVKVGSDAGAAADRLAAMDQAQQKIASDLAQLRGSFDQLRNDAKAGEQRLASAQDALRKDLTGLRNDLNAVSGRLDTLQQLTGTVASLQQASGAREAEIAQTKQAVDALRQQLQQDLAAVQKQSGQQISALQQQVGQQLTALQQQSSQTLAQAQQQVADRAASVQRAGALGVAAYELRVALERGGTIAPTVELVRRSADDDPDLKPIADRLAAVGDQPVPTLAALSQGLDEVAKAAAEPAASAPPKGWLGQATRNLGSLVELRAAEQAAPAAATAIRTARDALAQGDLAAAKAAVQPLATGGNKAAQDWVAAADRRQAVAEAADQLAARAQTNLASQ